MTGAIRDDIRQKRPFASLRQEATVSLLRTTDDVRRALAAVVEPHGITLQQFNVLRILRGAGDEGLPTLELGGRMLERSPGVTRLLDRLEAKKLVRRRRCKSDRRQVLCWIEPAGLELLAALDEPLRAADDSILASLDDDQVRTLIDFLDRVRASLDPR